MTTLVLAISTLVNMANAEESASALGCESGNNSLACAHKNEVETIWMDMNSSYSQLTDEIMQNPDSAIDAGCLNDISQVDLSVITIDPKNILSGIYAALKDQLLNMTCNAVNDKVNEASSYLDTKLEAPMGLGSVGLNTAYSHDISTFSDISDSRVRLSNAEATNQAVEEVFGERPRINRRAWGSQSVEEIRVQGRGVDTRTQRSSDQEELENILDVNRLFELGEDVENEEGN